MWTSRCGMQPRRSSRAERSYRPPTPRWCSSPELGLRPGVAVAVAELENAYRAATHAIAAPAEHHGIDPQGQDPTQQYLSRAPVQQPADEIAHLACRRYHPGADKTKDELLRL